MFPDLPTPRLSGRALRALRTLTATRAGARLVLQRMRVDYRIRDLLALDASGRADLALHPFPQPARKPASWQDQQLDPPGAPAWRPTHERLRTALHDGLSPVTLVERIAEYLAAGDFGHAAHTPFIALDMDRALAAAREARDRIRAGKPRSPLDGLPLPIKDEHDMQGLPTTGGSCAPCGIARDDSFVVAQLRQAGALLVGKTHTTEWGMNPIGTHPFHAFPHNPRHPDRAAGGSSTGSAVAVALHLAAAAIGSDGGGSIRIPSALCGLYGIKPTFARLSTRGNAFGGGTVAVGGPIAHSTADLVDVLEVLGASTDPDDWLNSRAPRPPKGRKSWRRALGRGVRGLRIGVPETEWAHADPAIAADGQRALDALAADGATLVPVHIPTLEHAPAVGVLSIAPETVANLADDFHLNGDAYGDDLAVALQLIARLGVDEYLAAQRTRTLLRIQTAETLRTVDVLALPTLPVLAPPYARGEEATAISDDVHTRAMCRFNFFANLTGLPAGTAPIAVRDGLPVGLQIIGDAWDEAAVLAVLAHLERLDLASALDAPAAAANLLA